MSALREDAAEETRPQFLADIEALVIARAKAGVDGRAIAADLVGFGLGGFLSFGVSDDEIVTFVRGLIARARVRDAAGKAAAH